MFPTRLKTHYSLLTSSVRPTELAKKAKELGYDTLALTDTHTVSGAVTFVKACKKEGVRPILGAEIAVVNSDKKHFTLTLLCKNKDAWISLLNIISLSNTEENFSDHPAIDIDELQPLLKVGHFIVIDGYHNSLLCEQLFEDIVGASSADNYKFAGEALKRDWHEFGITHVVRMQAMCGQDNYYLELNEVNAENNYVYQVLTACNKGFAEECQAQVVAGSQVNYLDHPEDHQLLLSIKMKSTVKDVESCLDKNSNYQYIPFFNHDRFTLLEPAAYKDCDKTATNTLSNIAEKCGDYDILSPPQLPHFKCPDGMSEIDYLRVLCREGWKSKIRETPIIEDPVKVEEYRLRVEHELKIIEEANIAGYFLIVSDIVNRFRKDYLIGSGRGSVGGSLIAYLTNITLVDPIPYGLLFSRFYNSARGKMGQLPDIDIDFPPHIRESVIDYIREVYGEDRVCQMITLGRLQGRSALQAVLKANDSASPGQVFAMTKKLPKEDKISDKLSEMEHPSVIRWTLENQPKILNDFCWLDEEGELQGEYAGDFEQAMRIEGTFKSQGIHAAGVIIAAQPVKNICPLVKPAKGFDLVGGLEMNELEAVGGVKVDILGLALLKKVQGVVDTINLLNKGEV